MIDIVIEELITLNQASQRLPKRPHLATIYRWIARGVRGIRLESIKIGGTLYTSAEALQRFADRLTAGGAHSAQPTVSASRRAERAEQELSAVGI